MAYIKISDPNVIDLAAWQQVINVVNQHSDSITAITNNFGIQGTGETNWNGESDLSHEYDPGSQKIVYGKNKFDPTSSQITSTLASNNVKYVYYGSVVFADEVSGYLNNDNIVDALGRLELSPGVDQVIANLVSCYNMLVSIGVVPDRELPLVAAWVEDCKRLQDESP